MCWIEWKACNKVAVHSITSLLDLVERTCSSKGFEWKDIWDPGRQISLNLTPLSQLLRPLTVLGGSHSAKGSSLCGLGDSFPFCQFSPRISAFWMFRETFDGFSLRSLSLHLWRIVWKILWNSWRVLAPKYMLSANLVTYCPTQDHQKYDQWVHPDKHPFLITHRSSSKTSCPICCAYT